MPTDKQLFGIWKAQFQLFGGSGLPRQSPISTTDGLGYTEEQITEVPINHFDDYDDDGEKIGTIEYDPAENELKVTLN